MPKKTKIRTFFINPPKKMGTKVTSQSLKTGSRYTVKKD